MRLARLCVLSVLSAVLISPVRPLANGLTDPDLRVTGTVSGARLYFEGVAAQSMRVFVVGGPGLRVFRHERLDRQRDGSFGVDLALTEEGLYMVFAEFLPPGGRPQMAQQAFTIRSPLIPRPGEPADEAHESNGVTATVDVSGVKAGGVSTLAFDVEPAGEKAGAEAFIVSSDLTDAQHLSAQDTSRGGHVVFSPIFPHSGRYKVWLIVPRSDGPANIPFAIAVP